MTVEPVADVETVPDPTILNAFDEAVADPDVALIVLAAVVAIVTVADVPEVDIGPVPVIVIAFEDAVAVPDPVDTVLIAVEVIDKVEPEPEVLIIVPSPETVTVEPVADPVLPFNVPIPLAAAA